MTFRRLTIATLMILSLAVVLAAWDASTPWSVTSSQGTNTHTVATVPTDGASSGHPSGYPPDTSLQEAATLMGDRVLAGIAAVGDALTGWIGELEAAEAEVARLEAERTVPNISGGGGGPLSHDQLVALARCESGLNPYAGDPSPWRTGFWGIEAGYPIGHMSVAEQEAWVQRIWAQHGARAWGCPIR